MHRMRISLMMLRGVCNSLRIFQFFFIPRGCNQVGRMLAKHALNCISIVTWIEEPLVGAFPT